MKMGIVLSVDNFIAGQIWGEVRYVGLEGRLNMLGWVGGWLLVNN